MNLMLLVINRVCGINDYNISLLNRCIQRKKNRCNNIYLQVHPAVLIQETEFCRVLDSCFPCSMFSLNRLSHEYSKHGLPNNATQGKNQQEETYVVESNGQQRQYCKWSGRN